MTKKSCKQIFDGGFHTVEWIASIKNSFGSRKLFKISKFGLQLLNRIQIEILKYSVTINFISSQFSPYCTHSVNTMFWHYLITSHSAMFKFSLYLLFISICIQPFEIWISFHLDLLGFSITVLMLFILEFFLLPLYPCSG